MSDPADMTPAGWAVLGTVLAGALTGFGVFLKNFLNGQVKWKELNPADGRKILYYTKARPERPERIDAAVQNAILCLMKNSRWPAGKISWACRDFKVYVYDDDQLAGSPGLAGYEEGGVIGLNRRLTTLCHEMGHLCQERIDGPVDYNHTTFEADGINKAERAYSDWLARTP